MSKFGLKEKDYDILQQIFSNYLDKATVLIYGSRARGNFKSRSDIDLVIKSDVMDSAVLVDIQGDIEDSDFPYLCDIEYFDKIDNPNLIERIEQEGKVIYSSD